MTSQRDPRTHAVIGAAMEVHRELGCGLREPDSQELARRRWLSSSRREAGLAVARKTRRLHTAHRADFTCFDSVIAELKALKRLDGAEEARVITYLKATGLETRLLLTVGTDSLQ